MLTLTKAEAKAIVNWYQNEGINNWGGWGNYPTLSVSAAYASFDVCHCRIMLDRVMKLEDSDETFNCISDSRKTPGKFKGRISFNDLEDYILTDTEKLLRLQNGWREDWGRAQGYKAANDAYESQSDVVKAEIAEIKKQIADIYGQPNSKRTRLELESKLQAYALPCQLFGWIAEAITYATPELYIAFKTEQRQK